MIVQVFKDIFFPNKEKKIDILLKPVRSIPDSTSFAATSCSLYTKLNQCLKVKPVSWVLLASGYSLPDYCLLSITINSVDCYRFY